MRGLAKTPV